MENHNEPAFPLITNGGTIQDGLTKREYFAAMAMQGVIGRYPPGELPSYEDIATMSIESADALIRELEK